MNRSRWISLGFLVLFMVVAIGVPAWKQHAGQAFERRTDGLFAAFALLCMGLVCIWWSGMGSLDTEAEESGNQRENKGEKRGSVKSVGWFLLVLSIVIAAADLIR